MFVVAVEFAAKRAAEQSQQDSLDAIEELLASNTALLGQVEQGVRCVLERDFTAGLQALELAAAASTSASRELYLAEALRHLRIAAATQGLPDLVRAQACCLLAAAALTDQDEGVAQIWARKAVQVCPDGEVLDRRCRAEMATLIKQEQGEGRVRVTEIFRDIWGGVPGLVLHAVNALAADAEPQLSYDEQIARLRSRRDRELEEIREVELFAAHVLSAVGRR